MTEPYLQMWLERHSCLVAVVVTAVTLLLVYVVIK